MALITLGFDPRSAFDIHTDTLLQNYCLSQCKEEVMTRFQAGLRKFSSFLSDNTSMTHRYQVTSTASSQFRKGTHFLDEGEDTVTLSLPSQITSGSSNLELSHKCFSFIATYLMMAQTSPARFRRQAVEVRYSWGLSRYVSIMKFRYAK